MNIPRSRASRFLIASALLAGLSSGCASLGFGLSVDALIDQGIRLYQQERYDESIAKFEEAIRRDPQRWVAYLYLARTYVVMRDWPSAILNGRRALEIQPGDGEIVKVLADALLGAGLDALRRSQWRSAVGHLLDYVALRPGDVQGYLGLARAHAGSGDFASAARALLDGLTSSDPAADAG